MSYIYKNKQRIVFYESHKDTRKPGYSSASMYGVITNEVE
jgi:hypothetical protein